MSASLDILFEVLKFAIAFLDFVYNLLLERFHSEFLVECHAEVFKSDFLVQKDFI